MKQETLRSLVKLYITANLLLEQMTALKHTGIFKHALKMAVNRLEKALEREITLQVEVMYEKNPQVIQGLELAMEKHIQEITQRTMELINEGHEG